MSDITTGRGRKEAEERRGEARRGVVSVWSE